MRPDPWRLNSEFASLLVEQRIQVEHLRALVALARADADRRTGRLCLCSDGRAGKPPPSERRNAAAD
jgi:hypothetical protein